MDMQITVGDADEFSADTDAGGPDHFEDVRNMVPNGEIATRERLRFIPIGEALESYRKELQLDARSPLVTLDHVADDGRVAVTFYDRKLPHYRYEIYINSPLDALQWIGHIAEKNWITTRHIEIFARLIHKHYEERGQAGAAGR